MRQKGFIPIIFLIVVVILGIVVFFVYTKGYISINLPKPRTSIIPSVLPTPAQTTLSITPSPITSITPIKKPTTNPFTNWKTFSNNDFTFRYPKEWMLNQTRNTITANVDGAIIYIFDRNSPMYNECMVLGKTDNVGSMMVKYYGYAYSGEACSDKNELGNYEAWITKAGGDGYQPGIIYAYNTTAFSNSFEIFKQILSTFKFTQ